MKNSTKIYIGIAVCIAIGIGSRIGGSAEHVYTPAEIAANQAQARVDSANAEIAAKAAKASSDEAQRYYAAAKGALIVQSEMRNPDSFQLATVGDMTNGALCYEYRAQNRFGGMDAGHATLVKNQVSLSDASWRANCGAKAHGADITEKVRGTMEFARTGKVSLW